MKSRTWAGIAAALALALSLSGCDAASLDAPDETASPAAAQGVFSDIDELRDAYVAAGGDCDDWEQTDRVRAAAASGDCSTNAVLMTFDSSSAAKSTADALLGMVAAGEERTLLMGADWLINAPDVRDVADSVGGEILSATGPEPAPSQTATVDLSSDAGLCAADAEMTNLELNDAIAPLLGYPADRDSRTSEQDQAIREYKNAAFERACPARAG